MINTGNIFGLFFALLVFFSYFFLELENLQIGRSGVEYGILVKKGRFYNFIRAKNRA